MSTTSLTAAEVLDRTASLMNDTAKSTYSYIVMIPYLNMALDELQEEFELNNVPVTNLTSAGITVIAGVTEIKPTVVPPVIGEVYYPTDLVEIQAVWERLDGSSEPFIPVTPREFLLHVFDDVILPQLCYYSWQDQKIKFVAASTDREVKLDYIKDLFVVVDASTDVIGIINSQSYLSFKTAEFCSMFIGENKTRADELKGHAAIALERNLGISSKGRQAITTRRRPFRSGYRSRGVW